MRQSRDVTDDKAWSDSVLPVVTKLTPLPASAATFNPSGILAHPDNAIVTIATVKCAWKYFIISFKFRFKLL